METAILKALADPTRRAVYERLAAGELSVVELTKGADVSQPAVSQHLAALKAAGLVRERRDGRRALYRATPEGLAPLTAWIDRYRGFWPAKVEKLKDILKEMEE